MVVEKPLRLTGSMAFINLILESLTAATGSNLTINNATGKDIEFVFTDAAGERSVLFVDSAAATVCKIDSNGLITSTAGLAGPVTGDVTGNLTKGSTDLTITAASAKDVIVKLGDADGAKKLIIKDSANAERASIDSDGTLTVVKIVGNNPIATAAAAPSKAGMISAFGAVAGKAGLKATYIDSTAETGSTYAITCDGTEYYATDLGDDVLT